MYQYENIPLVYIKVKQVALQYAHIISLFVKLSVYTHVLPEYVGGKNQDF